MSDRRREILERLSAGEIDVGQAEEELRRLEGKIGLLHSIRSCLDNLDICLELGNRIALEEEICGQLEPGPVELDLLTVNGSIRIETWDSPQYRLLIKKRVRAADQQEAEDIARQYKIADIRDNVIRARVPDQARPRRICAVSLLLQLPRGHAVSGAIETANGSVTLTGLENHGLRVRTSNGSIIAEHLHGGPLTANTVNGSIKAAGSLSQMEAGTTNGSITLHAAALDGDVSLKTVNGSIKVFWPGGQDTALALSASTVTGRIAVEHWQLGKRSLSGFGNKFVEARSVNWEQAARKLSLECSTVNGSITLKETE